MGDIYASGTLMNPLTGYPYLTPILPHQNKGERCYDFPRKEYLNVADGFRYMEGEEKKSEFNPHQLTKATIYTTRYFLVHNHKALNMMQASHPNDVIITDFTGTPIKGKKGGFSTGPQEQMTIIGLGAERLNFEISQFRSEFGSMAITTCNEKEEEEEEEAVIIPASKTLQRAMDEIRQYNIKFGVKIRKSNTMKEKDN